MPTYTTEELGRLIARAHYRAWRLDAPPFDLTPEELAAILPNLIKSGSAGIVWHRVKPVRERYGAMAYALEAATDAQIAHNQKVEEAVVECVTRLRAYDIEPVLVKGLSLAKLYPEGIVRPAGDIDLVVRKEEFAAAQAILHDSSRDPISVAIDLKHSEIWEELPNITFWERRRQLTLIDSCKSAIDILGRTDQLIMVAIHFLKHGGGRAIWLCDIALLLDGQDVWEDLSNGPTPHLNWMQLLSNLIHQLLGAELRTPHPSLYSQSPPSWFVPTLYRNWQSNAPKSFPVTATLISSPISFPLIMRQRWRDPITEITYLKRPFNDSSTRLAQVEAFAIRASLHIRKRMWNQIRSLFLGQR